MIMPLVIGLRAQDYAYQGVLLNSEESTSDIQSVPLAEVQDAADALFVYLRDILYNPKQASLKPEQLAEPFRDLAEGMLFIGTCINESRDLTNDFAQGDLASTRTMSPDNEIASGLKSLQSTLRHISWQVGQVAKGDYSQRLTYAGKFSEDLNNMILQLKERDDALHAEITLNQKIATDSRNTVLLLEGITKLIAEWVVVVDKESYEWLYTNHSLDNYLPSRESANELKAILRHKIDEYDHLISEGVLDTETPLQALAEIMGSDKTPTQYFSIMGYPIAWHEHTALVVILLDVTNEYREREMLEQVAFFDELTKAYSRHYGMEALNAWISDKQLFTVAFIDMDGLKYVNDTFGHIEGDDYICTTADKLRQFSDDALLCRLGGDEFMLLVRNTSAEPMREKLETMRTELAASFDGSYDRSFSFGVIEVGPENDKSASLLLSIADECMYEDKRNRKKERRALS